MTNVAKDIQEAASWMGRERPTWRPRASLTWSLCLPCVFVKRAQGAAALQDLRKAFLEASAAGVSAMKRGAERAARLIPDPEDEAWLCRQRQRVLQVREEGDLALRRRPDAKHWKSHRPQRLAEALWPEGWGAPNQRTLALGRLRLTHLLGAGGGWAKDRKPDSEALARRGAAWQPRAWEKQRAAVGGQKCRREDLVRPKPCRTKFQRTAVGVERRGAGKVAGWPQPPPGHPEKHKGKGGSSRKTHGGCCPADPRASRGLAAGKLGTAAGGAALLGEREEDVPWPGGRRQLGRTACLVPGLESNCPGQCPQGQVDSLAQLWPAGRTCVGGASALASLCQRSGKSRWQRELELAFEELFDMNRKLKRHLSQHLGSRPGLAASPPGERGPSEAHRWREQLAADAEVLMGPAGEAAGEAEVGARHPSPRALLQKALSKLESHASRRTVRPTLEGAQTPSRPEAGTPLGEESLPWGCTASRLGLPRLDAHPLQRDPQGQADRAGPVASRQKPKTEQRRPARLESLELPEPHLDAHGQTERGDESGPRTRAWPAPGQAASSPDQEPEGACERSPASPPATGSTNDDDSGHSQMIRDRQQQILEQNKLHKQFLEEARKRLREFQSMC
ncbi:protein DDC8 homolog [Glossophaga mutica]